MQSAMTVMSDELTEVKDKYSLSCSEVLVNQTEIDQLSSTFKEHVKHCSEQLQLASQNAERVTAEMQQQVESSKNQIQVAEEGIRRLKEEVEEKRHLHKSEASFK